MQGLRKKSHYGRRKQQWGGLKERKKKGAKVEVVLPNREKGKRQAHQLSGKGSERRCKRKGEKNGFHNSRVQALSI